MLDLEERNRARKKAMRLLEHMDRTEKGLTDKLRQAEFCTGGSRGCHCLCEVLWVHQRCPLCQNLYLLPHGDQEPSEDPLGTSVERVWTVRLPWMPGMRWKSLWNRTSGSVLRRTIEKKYAPDTELDEGQMRRLYGYLARRAFRYEDISHILEEMNIRVNRDME